MGAVLDQLTEEEAYLVSILTDHSGLDQAEFLWHAPEHYEGCFRAWPFQWRWWRNNEPLTIDQCARSIGKSLSIQVKSCAFPLLHPGHEMVLTAPEGVHLEAVTDLVETRLLSNRFYVELLGSGRNNGIKHRPLLIKFRNGARIMGRIPQRDGRGVKGTHPIWLEMDEAQDYPEAGWKEITETLKEGFEGARWAVHGVTRGVRDDFWKLSQPDSGWHVFQYSAMVRPTWTQEERAKKVKMYGSDRHPDYRRNVLGAHGDVQNPMFVMSRLLECCDMDPASDYNENIYTKIRITAETIEDMDDEILNCLDIPMSHKKYKNVWIGSDIGYTVAPTEILVFAEEKSDRKGETNNMLRLITRITLERVSTPDQAKLVLYLTDFYRARAYSLDKTGNGLPLFQIIQDDAKKAGQKLEKVLDVFKGYNFSSKILVDFDESIPLEDMNGDPVDDAAITRNVLEYSSDRLRMHVDGKTLRLPNDIDLIREFQGQTWTYDKSGMNMYGKKVYNQGSFHALDAARMAVLGHAQYGIEAFMREKEKVKKQEDVFDVFGGG